MRHGHLTHGKFLILLLLLEELAAEFHRCDLACEVIKVYRCSRLLQKVDALHADLVVLLCRLGFCSLLLLELEDAVFLVRLVLLSHYYFLKTLFFFYLK